MSHRLRALRAWLLANPKVIDGFSVTVGMLATIAAAKWFG